MPDPTHKYLDPAELQRLRHVVFASRRPVEGLYAGRHVSRQRGHSVEFTDYRPYMPGDEISDVDWKVYGRSDRLFIKRFEHQTDMTAHLLVDASASMAYGDAAPAPGSERKFDLAARVAAAIAFLVLRQQDRVSLSFAQDGLTDYHEPRGSLAHLPALLQRLEHITPRGDAHIPGALDRLASQVGRRGIVIILSDLLDDQRAILASLNRLLARGLEVIVFHVLHQHELDLPPLDSAVFADSESGGQITLHVDDIREDYQRRMRGFLDGWSTACRSRGIDYNLVSTAASYHAALEKYLFLRASLR